MNEYIKQSLNLIKVYFLGLFIFSVSRFIYHLRFGEAELFSKYPLDILKSFLVGLKFDTLVMCYILILIFVMNLFLLLNKEKVNAFIKIFSIRFFSVILPLLSFVLMLDQQFYTYFQKHFNIMVFAFYEDDTEAILASMWSDHPVIRAILLVIILAYVFHKIITKIYNSDFKISRKISIPAFVIGILLFFSLFFLGLRGSVGLFPLLIDDATVSENSFINNLTPNGVFTFIKAIEEKQKQSKPVTKKHVLESSGYKDIKDAVKDYKGFPKDSILTENYLDYIFETTDTNSFLAKNPPNVIFVLMESFVVYYFNFHSKKNYLFGSLDPNLEDGILFKNFLSATRGTIYSLESVLINKDVPILSNTQDRFKSFESSVAFPFQNAGYKTSFITGGKLGWRNLHELVPKQYFDESYGQAAIKSKNPKAQINTWGVYDEYLFDDIFNKLSTNPEKPKMIFGLSTSNHTPYELPAHYKAGPIEISDSLEKLISCDKELANLNFTAYQYSNTCLGDFLTELKASEYGKNTIVAVSGDHNSFGVFAYNNSSMAPKDNHIVPFFLHIPEAYKKDLHINTERYGSHKDIFPSLVNLSLANQKYFSLGNNLFDANKPDSLFYGINESYYFSDTTLSPRTLKKKVDSRKTINKYYFGH
jgi:phosphoglycerol transferase MdoB-like AlkP superfamily enzyme